MAGGLIQYSLLFVRVKSGLLSEEGSVSLRRMSGAQIVNTVAKGFAGMSPGAAHCEGRVSCVIPATGFEFDAGDYIKGVIPLEMGIRNSAGQEATINGFIPEDDASHGVNQEAKYEFSFIGQFPTWQ